MEPVALSSVQCLFQFQIHCLPDFPLICKCHLNRNDGNHLQWSGRQEREKRIGNGEEDHVAHTEKPCISANFSLWKDWRTVFLLRTSTKKLISFLPPNVNRFYVSHSARNKCNLMLSSRSEANFQVYGTRNRLPNSNYMTQLTWIGSH